MERLVSEMTYNVLMGSLNHTHSYTHSRSSPPGKFHRIRIVDNFSTHAQTHEQMNATYRITSLACSEAVRSCQVVIY